MKDRIVKGIFYLGGASLVSQIVTWLSTIVVARLLSPADYGLIALAGIYIGFAEYVNELGIGTAVIQRNDLNDDDVKGLYTISIALGLIMTLLTILVAPAVADYFKEARLTAILRFLSVTFVINSVKSMQRNLLIREMKFAEMAVMDGGSRILTSLGALTMALAGWGVWTLAAQYLLQNVIVFFWAFAYERRMPGKINDFSRLKEMLSFGAGITGSNILYCINRNVDQFVVGTMLGKVMLGNYSFAQTLADKPFEKLLSVFNQVFFAMFSKIQDDREKMRSYFFSIMEKELFILTPIFVTLILTSRDLVFAVLGAKWELMIIPLQLFAAIAVFKYLENRVNVVYRSLGRSRAQFAFTTVLVLVMAASLSAGGKFYGLKGVLVAWGVAYPLVFLVYLRYFLVFFEVSWKQFFALFTFPLVATVAMAASCFASAPLFAETSIYSLVSKVTIILTVYFLAAFILNRKIIIELWGIVMSQIRKTEQAV